MIGIRRSLAPFVFALWTLAAGDAEVSCVFMQSCILPCSFHSDTDVVIDWNQTAGNLLVHSYYNKQDQLASQNQRFRNRTSLFKDQISGGNASLQLTGVQVQDQGRYRCHTMTTTWPNKDSFINLKVDAPVHKVHIQQVENRTTCSSEGIYPKPELTWSISPPSTFKYTTRVQQTEQQLYNISSSLILSEIVTAVDYSCRISTRRNTRRVTLRQMASRNDSSSETSIKCTASDIPSLTGFNLIWTFNHSQIILTQTGTDVPPTVSEEWRQHVRDVLGSGSLILQGLSSTQEGTYTCELSNNEETFITNIFLRIEEGDSTRVGGFVGGVVVAILVTAAAVVCLVLYCKNKRGQKGTNNRDSNADKTNLSKPLPFSIRSEPSAQLFNQTKGPVCRSNPRELVKGRRMMEEDEDHSDAPQLQSNEDSGHTSQS